jgi:hypothetical protein
MNEFEQDVKEKLNEMDQWIHEHSTSGYTQILALTDGELFDIRNKERSFKGSEYAIPFSVASGATKSTTTYFISKQINQRFSLKEIEASFPSAALGQLQISVIVSDNNTSDASGYNVMSDLSSTPYLIGTGERVKAKLNPKEFVEGKYIKIVAVNGISSDLDLNVRVSIKVFPVIPQAN